MAIALPAAGNRSAGRGQSHCQPRAIEVPAAGNRIASRGQSKCQPRAIALPAAGNRSASRGYIECQPRAHRVPAAGTRSASRGHIECRGESYSQSLGIVSQPLESYSLGNRVPSRGESCSQPLGIVFPAAGNRVPKPVGNTIVLCHAMAGPWPCDCRPLAMRRSLLRYCRWRGCLLNL